MRLNDKKPNSSDGTLRKMRHHTATLTLHYNIIQYLLIKILYPTCSQINKEKKMNIPLVYVFLNTTTPYHLKTVQIAHSHNNISTNGFGTEWQMLQTDNETKEFAFVLYNRRTDTLIHTIFAQFSFRGLYLHIFCIKVASHRPSGSSANDKLKRTSWQQLLCPGVSIIVTGRRLDQTTLNYF